MATELQEHHVYISEDALNTYMSDRLSKINHREDTDGRKPAIHRVPDSLKHVCPSDYEPEIISIGPLHRHRPELKQMEHLKWTYLKDLINRSNGATSLQSLTRAVWEGVQHAKSEYSVDLQMRPGELVEVLVLDGCFLIELFLKQWCQRESWNLYMLRKDLLLLENQIPFFVLKDLFHASFPQGPPRADNAAPGEGNATPPGILDLALNYIRGRKADDKKDLGQGADEVRHLLHLTHRLQLRRCSDTGPTRETPSAVVALLRVRKMLARVSKKIVWGSLVTCFFFVVSLVLMCRCPRRRASTRADFPREMPSAKNLNDGGIHFRRKHENCYLSVSFDEESGTLEIPFLYLRRSTVCVLRNLIAWEHCQEAEECPFTTYARFMHGIVTSAQDVKILVRYGILEHTLGTDDDAAVVFNTLCCGEPSVICRSISRNEDDSKFYDLFKRISKYCDSDWHRWRAALRDNYLDTPWAVASVMTAVILLVLTLISTAASIWRAVSTAKSHDKQG